MDNEDLNMKARMKAEELKNQRAGKTMSIIVNKSNDKSANFNFFYSEVMELANMHQINSDEMFLAAAHMQLTSMNVKNQMALNMLMPTMAKPSKEELEAAKKAQEESEGKVRVKPDEEAKVEEAVVEEAPVKEVETVALSNTFNKGEEASSSDEAEVVKSESVIKVADEPDKKE